MTIVGDPDPKVGANLLVNSGDTTLWPPPIWPAEAKVLEAKPMRALYEVFVFRPEDAKVFGPYHVVAADAVKAQVKALIEVGAAIAEYREDFMSDENLASLDDCDVLVRQIGPVRPRQ